MKSLITAAAIAGITITLPTLTSAQEMTIANGQFRNADAVHTGTGTATITKSTNGAFNLELADFKTLPGPDLKVWLVEATHVQNSNDVKQSQWLALGPLQNPTGDQSYPIPADTDISKYGSAVIWCETFGVLFTTADLAASS